MKTSEQINKLAAALAKAQCAFEAAERGHVAKVTSRKGEGSSYSFNYADLAAYLDVCRAPLGENGLSFVQIPTTNARSVSVVTLLMHASGQYLESDPFTLDIAPDERGFITPQAVGSAVTYARRYSLSALIGMASEADDDGNAASGNDAQTGPREQPPACPSCGKSASVIKGKPEYGGGWHCWKKRDGCGHTWQPGEADAKTPQQRAQELAAQHGMTTGDQLPPGDGQGAGPAGGAPSKAEMEAHQKYSRWFAAAWTEEAYRAVLAKMSAETSQSLKSQLEIARGETERRVALAAAESVDADTFEQVLIWVDKTPAGSKWLKDLEKFCDWALNANPSPFSDEQKARLYKALERQQGKK